MRRWAGLALDAPALAALVLPFAYLTSPLGAIRMGWPEPDPILIAFAAPLFLALPIALWQARQSVSPGATLAESVLAGVLAVAAMSALPSAAYLARREIRFEEAGAFEWLGFGAFVALALANVILLLANMARSRSREVTAGAFLQGAYLPHAVLLSCLFAGEWNSGALAVAAACLGYLVRLIRLARLSAA